MERNPEQHWPRLAAGTEVGPWRVEAWQGQGGYGAVYRAVRVGQEPAVPVALKLSLYAWDGRFGREAELLSRVSHPSIPRLLDRGSVRQALGAEHPFLVMEWVEGTPLYAWAEQHAASYRQHCALLAQVARALEALHAAGGVHRDVKGDNVLVRLSDRLPVLIDFGSGHFQGAPRLTWQTLAPGTPAYFSAQAWLFDLRLARHRDSYYAPTPADDLFALGVTAYRLVMGEYPPAMDVQEDAEGAWQVRSRDPRPLLERNARVEPELREWIVRLLSDDPEARGTAAQVAEALEAAAEARVPEPEPQPAVEVSPPKSLTVAAPGERSERARGQWRERAWEPALALAAVGVCAVLLWRVQPEPVPPSQVSVSPPREAEYQVPDAGTAATGDGSGPAASAPPRSEAEPMAQEPPPRRQLQPDKKGRCPGNKQVVIDGSCWVETASMTPEECVENGHVLRKGRCYAPALESPQKPVPTSSPAKPR